MSQIDKIVHWIGSPTSLWVHTVAFVVSFAVGYLGYAPWDLVLLVVTTIVSLEAIYLAIFIQMTVNRHTQSLAEVEEDLDDIEEEIKTIEKDVDDIQEDIEDMEEGEEADNARKLKQAQALSGIGSDLKRLLNDIESMKGVKKDGDGNA